MVTADKNGDIYSTNLERDKPMFVKQVNFKTINIVLFLFLQSIEATSYHGLIEKMDIKYDDHEMLSLFTDLVTSLKGAFSCFVLFCKYSSVF